MKVTINHTTSGLMKTKYNVVVRIDLSNEERAVLDQRKLWKEVIIREDNPHFRIGIQGGSGKEIELGTRYIEWQIKHFVSGFTKTFPSVIEAKAFDVDLRETHLPKIKAYIDHSKEPGKASDTFEM